MKKYMLEAIIVLVIIVGLFTLILLGVNGEVKGMLGLAIGYILKGTYDVALTNKPRE